MVQIVDGNCGKDVGLHGGGALVRGSGTIASTPLVTTCVWPETWPCPHHLCTFYPCLFGRLGHMVYLNP